MIEQAPQSHTAPGQAARLENGYLSFAAASFGHAGMSMLRRNRIVLAAVISLLPVFIPLALAFLSNYEFADRGNEIFVRMMTNLYLPVLAPLLGLFFAAMLVGEDVESQTMSYMLIRPIPRSAWVLGRFLAYVVVSSVILFLSVLLIFAACTALADFSFRLTDLQLMLHYDGIALLALLAYGAVSMFMGTVFKRPIIYGVILFFGWQRLAGLIPGLIDFLTVEKYIDSVLPRLATQRGSEAARRMLWATREIYLLNAGWAVAVLLVMTVLFVAATAWAVRRREFPTSQAAGG